MQMLAFPYYEKRILHYACKFHQQQLHEGHDYVELRPTISISFLNHVWFPQVHDYHLRFRLLEESHSVLLTEDLEFHVLELPKFNKSVAELTDGVDRWLYFLRHAEMMDVDTLPTTLQQPLVVRALEELKMLTQTELERERYEARRKAQLDENTLAKVARQEGTKVGEKIGVIHTCERFLNQPESPTDELSSQTLDELTRLADDLLKRVLKQR
jgi:predicted transposase/invertase (TIGR01784 family)